VPRGRAKRNSCCGAEFEAENDAIATDSGNFRDNNMTTLQKWFRLHLPPHCLWPSINTQGCRRPLHSPRLLPLAAGTYLQPLLSNAATYRNLNLGLQTHASWATSRLKCWTRFWSTYYRLCFHLIILRYSGSAVQISNMGHMWLLFCGGTQRWKSDMTQNRDGGFITWLMRFCTCRYSYT
jgi:hypothetical protein